MRNTIILLYLFILFPFVDGISQENDLNTMDTTNTRQDSSLLLQKKKYLNTNFTKEKTLFKIGTSPLAFFTSKGDVVSSSFNGIASVEQKIIPAISVIFECNCSYLNDGDHAETFVYSAGVGFRFYYLINSRLKQSTGANNFHSNYISIGVDNCINNINSESGHSVGNVSGISTFTDLTSKPEINLAWGMQRRIGTLLFVDIGPYMTFNEQKVGLGLNLLFGLGLGR